MECRERVHFGVDLTHFVELFASKIRVLPKLIAFAIGVLCVFNVSGSGALVSIHVVCRICGGICIRHRQVTETGVLIEQFLERGHHQ